MGLGSSSDGAESMLEEVSPGDSHWNKVVSLIRERSQKHEHMYGFSIKLTKLFRVRPNQAMLQQEIELARLGAPTLLFHGTLPTAADSIIKGGFRLPEKAGMFGQGVYFAKDPLKSAAFAKSGSAPQKEEPWSIWNIFSSVATGASEDSEEGKKFVHRMLLCDVYLGCCRTLRLPDRNFEPRTGLRKRCVCRCFGSSGSSEYNSVRAPGGTFGAVRVTEFVVYREDQAVPRFLLEFEKVRVTKSQQQLKSAASPKRSQSGLAKFLQPLRRLRRSSSAPAAVLAGKPVAARGRSPQSKTNSASHQKSPKRSKSV